LIDLFIVLNATFSNISVLVVGEAEVPRENHRPWASNWQALSLAAPFFVIYKTGANPRRVDDRLV
jgi:hypothetical protein